MTISYDRKYDILYVRDQNGGHSYVEEDPEGIAVYKNVETDCITGIAIYDITERLFKEAL